MHKQSFELMQYFVGKYLNKTDELEILDIGSYDVNGSYKSLFQNKKWKYLGLDLIKGPNVDVICKSSYDFGLNKQYDVVISGNCLEHVEAPWKWIKEVEKATKEDGMVCIITPFSLGEHKYPVDCWRILPDGFKYLLEQVSNFTVLETRLNMVLPELHYKFFESRPKWNWLLRLLPGKVKRKVFGYYIYPIQDSYVIARKNNN